MEEQWRPACRPSDHAIYRSPDLLSFSRGHNPRNPLKVRCDLDFRPASQQFTHFGFFGVADFGDEPTAGAQMFVSLRYQASINFHPFAARKDRDLRLKFTHLFLHLVGIAFSDVGRIGDYEVKALAGVNAYKVGFAEKHSSAQSKPGGVDARNFQGFLGDVAGVNFRVRQLAGQRQGNASRAGAYVQQLQASGAVERVFLYQLQNGFYHMLSFRARDEHGGRDQQIQPPELLMAGDVLRGAASRALANNFIKTGLLIGGELPLGMGVKIGALAAENKQQQQLGVQAGGWHVIFDEDLVRGINGLLELHAGETLPQRTLRTQREGTFTAETRRRGDFLKSRTRVLCG